MLCIGYAFSFELSNRSNGWQSSWGNGDARFWWSSGQRKSHFRWAEIAIAEAVTSQMSMNLDDSDVLVQSRDKTTQKTEDTVFAITLSGTLFSNAHPFKRLNQATQQDHALFQSGQICMQIWFPKSMN